MSLRVTVSNMTRTRATVTQANVARAIRAAKQAGAEKVIVRPNGEIVIELGCAPANPSNSSSSESDASFKLRAKAAQEALLRKLESLK